MSGMNNAASVQDVAVGLRKRIRKHNTMKDRYKKDDKRENTVDKTISHTIALYTEDGEQKRRDESGQKMDSGK